MNGIRLGNVRTSFSLRQPDQTDDGVILLVTPTSQMREAVRIYKQFLRSVAFGH
jgi:hypothetical protein